MNRSKTCYKAVSWRVVASTDTFILAYVCAQFFNGAQLAAAIACAEIPTKLLIYYLHERVWIWALKRKGVLRLCSSTSLVD